MKHTDDEHVICDVVPDPSSLVTSKMSGCNTANGKSGCAETGSEVNAVEAGNEDVSTAICVDHEENMVNTENEVTKEVLNEVTENEVKKEVLIGSKSRV